LFGGVLYAVFWPAVYSERTVLLEGLANTFLLGGLIAISPPEARPSKTRLFCGGVLLGLGAAIKVWGVVPVLILFGWLLVGLGFRRASVMLLGAISSCAAVCLPFFFAAPTVMWRLVVRDQLSRVRTDASPIQRLTEILGLGHLPARITLPLVLALIVLVAGVVLAWQVARARAGSVAAAGLGCDAARDADLVHPLFGSDCAGNRHYRRRRRPPAVAPFARQAIALAADRPGCLRHRCAVRRCAAHCRGTGR